MQGTLKWKVVRDGAGWRVELHLPGDFIAAGRGATKPDALHRAASFAQSAMANPAVKAALPPGTAAAVNLAASISQSPAVRKVIKDVGPKAAKRLVKAISSFW